MSSRFLCRLFCFILTCFLFLKPVSVHSDDAIIISLNLNQEKKGDYFVILRNDGDFLLRPEDLTAIGIQQLPDDRVFIDNEPMISIRNMPGIDYRLDEATLVLELTSRPELLAKTTIDLSPNRQPGVIYSRDSSIFLNYGADYTAGGKTLDYQGLSVSNELGIRYRDYLLLTDSLYAETPDDKRFVRLNTQLTRDWETNLDRLTIGDFFASSGDLGHQVHLGGVSFSRIYDIDPYFINYPLFDFSGQLPLPSTVETFVNGRQISSERLSPGEFELRNLQSISGAQEIEVVIRDALGREQRIRTPFYFTDKLLRRGMHEFSYNLGLQRKNFGMESADYAGLAASFFHSYGFNDHLNLGLSGEAKEDLVNLGAESVFLLGHFGLFKLAAASSQGRHDRGVAGLFSYDYQNRTFRARLAAQIFSENYLTLNDVVSDFRTKNSILGAVSYYSTNYGSFSLDYVRDERFDASQREALSFSWSRRILADAHLYLTLRQGRDTETFQEATLNLTWYLGDDHSATGSFRHERSADIAAIEARKTVPSGAGTGWNLYGERTNQSGNETRQVGTTIQHNARHAVLRGEYNRTETETEGIDNIRLTLAGAVASLGGKTAFTRPITDSFALINVGGLEGVRVYRSNQLEGSTNADGDVIISDLNSYYENQVSIEDQDIPLDFLMPRVRTFVSPPLRGGACLNFPLHPHRAFTGTLLWQEAASKESSPLKLADVTLETSGSAIRFQTDSRGSFYFDNEQAAPNFTGLQGCTNRIKLSSDLLPAGIYTAKILMDGKMYSAEMVIPSIDEPFHEMGEIILKLTKIITEPKRVLEPDQFIEKSPIKPIINAPPELEKTIAKSIGATAPSTQIVEEKLNAVQETSETAENKNPRFTIHFPLDSSIPLPEDQPTLDQALNYLIEHPERPIDIEGHADQQGSTAYNQKLGYWRAQALRDYLVNAGINPQRFSRIVSYGESKPLCQETSEDCLRQNRRAIVLVAITPEN